MMRFLLINPFCPISEGPTPPLGVAFLAAALEQAGIDVRVLDLVVTPYSKQRLAAILDVPVIFFIGLYLGGNKYEIYFDKLVSNFNVDRENRDVLVEQCTKKYVKSIEKYVRHEPLNWFNFYDYWKDEQK